MFAKSSESCVGLLKDCYWICKQKVDDLINLSDEMSSGCKVHGDPCPCFLQDRAAVATGFSGSRVSCVNSACVTVHQIFNTVLGYQLDMCLCSVQSVKTRMDVGYNG